MKEQKNKILNLPNQISLFRFVCTPIMVLLFLLPIEKGIGVFVALGIFLIGSLSDIVDGHIARKYNMVTDFGKLIDSIADKFLQTAGLIIVLMSDILEDQWVAIVIVLICVLRDILINGIRQIAATKGKVVAADFFGKLKTVFIDVAIAVMMLYIAFLGLLPNGDASKLGSMPIEYILTLGFSLLTVGACLSVLSAINYTVANWRVVLGLPEKEVEHKDESTSKKGQSNKQSNTETKTTSKKKDN